MEAVHRDQQAVLQGQSRRQTRDQGLSASRFARQHSGGDLDSGPYFFGLATLQRDERRQFGRPVDRDARQAALTNVARGRVWFLPTSTGESMSASLSARAREAEVSVYP